MTYQKLAVNFFADGVKVLEEKFRNIVKKLVYLIIESDFMEIKDFYQTLKPGRYSGQAYLQESEAREDTKKMIYCIGYMNALLDFTQLYLEKVSEEKEIDGVKTKYKDDILLALMEKRIMFHKDLAGAIGVSPSGLNAVIRQMNGSSVKLINVDNVSKFKLYSLTPAAHKYCTNLIEKADKKEKQQLASREKNTDKKEYLNDQMLTIQWKSQRESVYEYIVPYGIATVNLSDKYINRSMEMSIANWRQSLSVKANY